MPDYHESPTAQDMEIPAELLRWLDTTHSHPRSRALVRHGPPDPRSAPRRSAGDAELAALERALGEMERRLAATAARHDRALSQIRARLDRLRDSVGKVTTDQFVNGKALDGLLSGLAARVSALESGGWRQR